MFAAGKAASGAEPTDAQFNYVTMLLHGNGTNGAQNNTFLDSSTNNFTITRNGNTTQGTFTPYGSNWSNYFGANNALRNTNNNTALQMSTGDFTLEMWIFSGSISADQGIFDTRNTGAGAAGIFLRRNNSGDTISYVVNGSVVVSTGAITQNTWQHLALVRQSGTARIYLNGVQAASASSTTDLTLGYLTVGAFNDYLAGAFNGYMSNVRLVKGTCLYPSGTTFTPPTSPLTAVSGTSLLTCADNRFIDDSTNAFALTVSGSPSVQRFSPFSPTTAYSTSVIGGSGYFDGSGDYLSTTASSVTGGDFTIEAWVYLTSTSASAHLFSFGTNEPNRFSIYRDNANNKWSLAVVNGGSYTITAATSTAIANAWSHVAWVRSGSTNYLCVNGVREASNTASLNSGTSRYIAGNFGGSLEPIPGYISDFRVSTSALYTGTTYTVPTAPFSAGAGTNMLLSYTNAGILDNAMMNDLETVGNAQISTSVKKYGSASMYFDGTGDILSTPASQNFVFNGDFTVEGWVYIDSTMASSRPDNLKTFIFMGWNTGNTPQLYVYGNTTTAGVGVGYYDGTTAWEVAATVPKDQWVHIAYVRTGTALYGFVNGARYTINASISAVIGSSNTMVIAGNPNQVSAYYSYLKGYIDDLRITKGVARYTANFSVPTAAFPDKG